MSQPQKMSSVFGEYNPLFTLGTALCYKEYYERHIKLWNSFKEAVKQMSPEFNIDSQISSFEDMVQETQKTIQSVLDEGYEIVEKVPIKNHPRKIKNMVPVEIVDFMIENRSKLMHLKNGFIDFDMSGIVDYKIKQPDGTIKTLKIPHLYSLEVPDIKHPYKGAFVLQA